jgi:hypothetical protein
MKLQILYGGGGSCASSNCPTVFIADNGNYVIQGYKIKSEVEDVDVPNGEALIEVPKEFIEGFLRSEMTRKNE